MSVWCCLFTHFFFFKQKTAYEMRISDWSSDVCSSDLRTSIFRSSNPPSKRTLRSCNTHNSLTCKGGGISPISSRNSVPPDRKSVVSGKSVSVRVDLGGRRIIKKKHSKYTDNNRQDNKAN